MNRFLQALVLGIIILSIAIVFFYIPSSPLYVLGNLREGSIGAWIFWNLVLSFTLALAVFVRHQSSKKVLADTIIIVNLLLLALLHILPSLLYWDTFLKDGILRDDIGTAGPKANIFMFLWHLVIMIGSALTIITILAKPFFNKKSGKLC